MGKINWGRVILGGVLWCIVYNILSAGAWFLFLKSEWAPAVEKLLGRPFPELPKGFGFFLILTLAVGIFAVWFYAAIRPRYGPGPKTAAGAGFALWLIGHLLPTLAWGLLLELSPRLIASTEPVALVSIVAATLVGAWPYKE